MGLLRIANVLDLKSLVAHENSQDPYKIPDAFQGESPDIEYTALQRDALGTFLHPWAKLDPASYSLAIGMFLTSNGTRLAYQNAFTSDSINYRKAGQLVYDSAAITAALGADSSIAITWEIELTTGAASKFKSFQQAGTLRKQFITPSALTVPPTDIAATQSWVKQTCLPRDGSDPNNPADIFYIKSRPGGFVVAVYPDDDGTIHGERLN